MAKIPQPENLQRREISGNQPVSGYSTQGVSDPLEHLSNMLQTEADAQTEYQVKSAEVDLVTYQSEFEDRAKKDQDYGTLEKRYSEDMNGRITKTAANIQIPSVKQAFIEAQRTRMQAGTERIRNMAFGKQKDFERDSTNTRLNNIKKAVLSGKVDFSSGTAMVKSILSAGVNNEFYSHEESGKVTKAFQDNLAIEKLTMMDPEERLGALSEPWAKNLPSSVVSTLRKEAKADAIQSKVYSFADEQIAKGATLSEGMKAASKIKDPDERLAAENRFKSLYSTEATAKKESEYDSTEAVLKKIYDGQDPTPQEWASLGSSGRRVVEAKQKADAAIEAKKFAALEADQETEREEKIRKYDIALKTGAIKFNEVPEEVLMSLPSKEFDMLVKSSKMSENDVPDEPDYDLASYQVLNDILATGDLKKGREFLIDNADKLGKKYASMSDRISKAMDDPKAASGIKSIATYSKKIKLMNGNDKDGKKRAMWMDGEFIKWHDQFQLDNGREPDHKESEAEMNKLFLDQKEKHIFGRESDVDDQEEYIENIIKRRGEEAKKRAEGTAEKVGSKRIKYSDHEKIGGSRSWRNNNPGNIEYGEFAKRNGAIGTDGRFAIFPDEDTGHNAKVALLNTSSYRNKSIKKAIERYAPQFENDSKKYADTIASAAGVPTSTKIKDLSPEQFDNLVRKMTDVEGWKEGTVNG